MKKRGHAYKTNIIIQAFEKPVSEFDPNPAEWVTVFDTWCSVRPARKSELNDGEKMTDAVTHVLHMRWLPNIRASMRGVVVDKKKGEATDPAQTRVFYIDSVVDLQDRARRLQLRCEERFETVYFPELGNWIWQNADNHIWQNDDIAIWSA